MTPAVRDIFDCWETDGEGEGWRVVETDGTRKHESEPYGYNGNHSQGDSAQGVVWSVFARA